MANLMPLYAVHCENSIFISFHGFGALFEFSEQVFACPVCISVSHKALKTYTAPIAEKSATNLPTESHS